jgi:hypothetical protein
MNVEIGTEAAQFPEKEYINGIFFAVCVLLKTKKLIFRTIVPADFSILLFSYYYSTIGPL